MHNNFKFNNPALQDAVSEVGDKLAGFNDRLDAISADIKQLENWLQSTGFCISFDVLASSETGYNEFIRWQECGKSWRIMYDCVMRDFVGGIEYRDFKPLIETKAEIRLRCMQALPEFVKEAAELLSKRGNELTLDEIFEGELPF